jgi:hypothetical protein
MAGPHYLKLPEKMQYLVRPDSCLLVHFSVVEALNLSYLDPRFWYQSLVGICRFVAVEMKVGYSESLDFCLHAQIPVLIVGGCAIPWSPLPLVKELAVAWSTGSFENHMDHHKSSLWELALVVGLR